MNVDDSVRMALSEVTRPASVGSVSEVTAELGSLAGTDASGGASIGSPPSCRPTLSPCFKCEYDVKEKRYVIREPKVIVPGQDKPIEPEDPGELHKNRTYVCAVTRENNKVKAEIVEEDKVPDDALVSVPICKIDDSRGFDIITQYHVGAIVLGGTTFVGDMDGSEVIGGAGEEILVTGHPGAEDSSGQDSHSGILFLTVSGRTGQGGEKIPAKIIARIKDKKEDEDWAAKTMTVPISGGGTKIVHFLGCDDVDLTENESGGGSDVEIKGGTGIKVTKTNTGDKVTATVSNTGVIGLLGQDASQAANGTITTKGATGSGLKVTVTRTAEPTEKEPLSNGTLEVDIDGRDKNDTFGIHTMTVKGAKDEDDKTVRFLATEDIEIDDRQCVKKDKTPADNRFDGGKGVSFGSEGSKFSLSTGTSNLALVLDHTTGQVLSVPVDVDSYIAVKRRKLQVLDGGNATVGYTTIGYGDLTINGISGQPYISFRSADAQVASIQPNSSTKVLYINSADFGITLNGKQDNVKCLNTPTVTLENAANDLNIANLKWISSQLKQLKLDGDDTSVKLLATANVDIKQKKLEAGTGIKLTEANGKITISATGAETSGFTGSRTVLADTQYSGHYLQKRFHTETWKDGVLESSTLGNWITYHKAVEETA